MRKLSSESHVSPTRLSGTTLAVLVTTIVVGFSSLAPSASASEVSFTDGAYDAYRMPGNTGTPPSFQPPNPLLSDPKADILEVSFASVTTRKGGSHRRSYSASMAIAGAADPGYSYVVTGRFGPDCQLYHFLKPGITSFANAFCGSGDTRRFVGQVSGSAVVLDGTRLSATYTYMPKHLPPELRADTELGGLFAYTCVSDAQTLACTTGEVLDYIFSDQTFTI